MSNKEHFDYIIVGQGIAGSILALKLRVKGFTVKIIDNGHKSSSSLIAGGVTHPMSFKRIIPSWKADTFIPYAIDFYNQLEEIFSCKLFYKHKMARIFSGMEEQNNWQGRMADSPMIDLIYDFEDELNDSSLLNSFGMGGVNLAGRLDIKLLLEKTLEHFKSTNQYQEEEFNYDLLEVLENKVIYKDISADRIVFCEGYKYTDNPYFNYLPKNLTKGEILIIRSKNIPNIILSKGCFLLPLGDDLFVLGATYNRENFDNVVTSEGKSELIEKLEQVGDFDFEIVEHRAGVRPTTTDRKPIIGKHPKIDKIFIFNGLGSKGVMLAPFYADYLIEHITANKAIEKEVSIDRFSKKHLHKFSK